MKIFKKEEDELIITYNKLSFEYRELLRFHEMLISYIEHQTGGKHDCDLYFKRPYEQGGDFFIQPKGAVTERANGFIKHKEGVNLPTSA